MQEAGCRRRGDRLTFTSASLFPVSSILHPSMPLPISSPTGVLATLSGVCAFFFWLEKVTGWRFFQFVPPLIFIYLVPMILSNNGVLPAESPVYGVMGNIMLPMLLVLLLLKLNIRGAVHILGPGLGVMLFGTLGVMAGADRPAGC